VSDFRSVAAVTETLRQMLDAGVEIDVTGASATAVRPVAQGNDGQGNVPEVGVNVFLYGVSPNPSWRNSDLPTRRADGSVIQRPRLPLDLSYLFTFYGNDNRSEPQLVLGSVIRTIHAHPVLTREQIRAAVSASNIDGLEDTDLDAEIELVKFTMIPMSLEELSKFWSIFFQSPYVLSIAYKASVIFIDGKEQPSRALPVAEPLVYVEPFRHPTITSVEAEGGPGVPITVGGKLIIRGKNLMGDVTKVSLGGTLGEPGEIGEERIGIQLLTPPVPAEALRAGVQGVQVVHERTMGKPPVPHRGVESNVFAFVLRPSIAKNNGIYEISVSSLPTLDISIGIKPPVFRGQKAVLLLNEKEPVGHPGRAYSFSNLPLVPPSGQESINTLTFKDLGIEAGEYIVRVQIDGAESPVDVEGGPAAPKITGPVVSIH
jgi:hypothetical protein